MIQYISKPFKYFFKLESASGLVLLFAAVIALFISNSNLGENYFKILESYFTLGTEDFGLKLSVLHWINDVLMAIFFFLVSLEIKREFIQGELSKPKQALLPIIGAVGGMLVPALIYVFINLETVDTLRGWAIPSATDIAFSIGVLSLLGSRVPVSLKVFLVALAIIDDLGAIIIIAFFYSSDLHYLFIFLMIGSFIALTILNKVGIKRKNIDKHNKEEYLQLKRIWNLLFKSEYVISDGLKIARQENLFQSSARLCEFIELSTGKGRRGPMPSLMPTK